MNRIILIGNGFDLAHGLKTKYEDFIDNLWEEVYNEVKLHHTQKKSNFKSLIQFNNRLQHLTIKDEKKDFYNEILFLLNRERIPFSFSNYFLKIIMKSKSSKNWVDIENEYYDELKKIIKIKETRRPISGDYTIDQLNSDFKEIKERLVKYLQKIKSEFDEQNIVNPNIINKIGNKVYSEIKVKDLSGEFINKFMEEEFERFSKYRVRSENFRNLESLDFADDIPRLSKKDLKIIEEVKYDFRIERLRHLYLTRTNTYFNLAPERILFLNFNYTLTESLYSEPADFGANRSRSNNIHIHGDLIEGNDNRIIFGFGDELDDEYKTIEKMNDNKYLENVKSINYLETNNYRKLLEFANSDDYQIFIFGHSCGNSDRTMLNTLFEHDNCASIKVFYHQKEGSDNFSDVVGNISRNFNSKAKLRDRVVNKMDSEPLS